MKRLVAFVPLIALLVVVAMSALLLLSRGEREAFAPGILGQPAPAYELPSLAGGDLVSSEAMHGRAHVINVFASWCAPCRVEHPQLMRLQRDGVPIVGVAYKDEAADTRAFLAELGDPFTMVGMDPNGQLGLALGFTGAPETYVVDAAGVVRVVHRGPLTEQIVASRILPALDAR